MLKEIHLSLNVQKREETASHRAALEVQVFSKVRGHSWNLEFYTYSKIFTTFGQSTQHHCNTLLVQIAFVLKHLITFSIY